MSYDEPYRDSYRDVSVHKMMLTDVVRTEAYERALRRLVKPDAKVMDFGCGTGVLSIFASKFGAKTVYAVDRSSFILVAQSIARTNKIDNIHFYHDDHKSLVLPGKVDLLVSEWMGHFIFYEAMLEPLIHLRNKYLAKGGIMLPYQIDLFAGFVTEESFYEELSFFRQTPYGIDFSPIADAPLHQTKMEFFTPNQVSRTVVKLGNLDLYTIQSTPQKLTGTVIPQKKETVYGLCGWFEAKLTDTIAIGTGPNDPPTHWNQLFFPFNEPFDIYPAKELSIQICPPFGADDTWCWMVTDGTKTIKMKDLYPCEVLDSFGPLQNEK